MSKDYYKILGVEKNASQDDIKRAYKKLAKQFHPDVNKDSGASEKFKEINEAAAVLGNAEKRSQYDQFGTADGNFGQGFGFDPRNSGFDFDDIFDNIFAGFGFDSGRRRSAQQRGRDLAYELEVSLEEVAKGSSKKLELDKFDACEKCSGSGAKKGSGSAKCDDCNGRGVVQHTRRTPFGIFATTTTCSKCSGAGEMIKDACSECNGSGRVKLTKTITVKIPAGVEDGTRLRVQGEGEAGERGGRSGDLFVIVYVQEHEKFRREGNDVFVDAEISFVQACLGGEIEVPTIDGNATLKIPAGTQPNTVLRMRGKGLPSLDGDVGDENVQIKVAVPTKLSKDQTALLKQFDEASKKKKGWLF